ncbi:hypothetical protein ACIP5N_33995 [Streptomyces sp. NPDC088768]|uniref:hypothetical protein n=1 Tax=Streptomyces sp. NPDC088768 TaxID=3365894 RepID=UPI00382851FC
MKEALHSHPRDFRYRDLLTGMAHSHIRWTTAEPPTPYGCRWCGTERAHHGMQYLRGRGVHGWEQPTQAQILARMKARRAARTRTP